MGGIFGPLWQPRPLPELTFAYRTSCEAELPIFAKRKAQKKIWSHVASTEEDVRRGAARTTARGTEFLGCKRDTGFMAGEPT